MNYSDLTNLFSRYYDRLVRYCLKYVSYEAEAQDIVQDCFVKLWERRGRAGDIPAEVYLYTMVRNACFNLLKHKAIVSNFEVRYFKDHSLGDYIYDLDFLGGPAGANPYEKLYLEVRRQTDRLPDRCREAFVLSRFEGLSNKEIAEKMGISEPAVHKLLRKGAEKLRKLMDF